VGVHEKELLLTETQPGGRPTYEYEKGLSPPLTTTETLTLEFTITGEGVIVKDVIVGGVGLAVTFTRLVAEMARLVGRPCEVSPTV
jgi:hypothetical protein